MEKLKELLTGALKSLALLGLAWLGTVGYFSCHLLSLNAIYCDPFPIRIPFFIVLGALLNGVLRRIAGWAFGTALLLAIILAIVSLFAPLPPRPEWIIEVGLVIPFQIAIGVIVGQVLMWIWVRFGRIFIAWLRGMFGQTRDNGEADGTPRH
jgi:hypothetical protein